MEITVDAGFAMCQAVPMTNTEASINVVRAVADAIRSLKTVPSGHLYAQLMGHLTLAQYESIISVLVDAGVVTERGHLLTWVGPPK